MARSHLGDSSRGVAMLGEPAGRPPQPSCTPLPKSHRFRGWWVSVPEAPAALGRFPAGPGWGSLLQRGCAWLSPQTRGLEPSRSAPNNRFLSQAPSKKKKKEQKTPTIIKGKKKSRLFPVLLHFPALCFPAPTHLPRPKIVPSWLERGSPWLQADPWGWRGFILL